MFVLWPEVSLLADFRSPLSRESRCRCKQACFFSFTLTLSKLERFYLARIFSLVYFGRHDGQHSDFQHNDTQHRDTLRNSIKYRYVECRYAERRYAERRFFIVVMSIIILNVVILSVIWRPIFYPIFLFPSDIGGIRTPNLVL